MVHPSGEPDALLLAAYVLSDGEHPQTGRSVAHA